MLALETYSIIFEMICKVSPEEKSPAVWGTRLAFYTPGLFAFYQFARLEIKLKFNELIKKYYLSIGREIFSCVNALVGVMLLGLDDQSEEAVKSIEDILMSLERKIGTKAFYASVWLAIYRTSKCRYPAFKYIMKNIPDNCIKAQSKKIWVFQGDYMVTNIISTQNDLPVICYNEDNKEIDMKTIAINYYPHKSSLILNAITQSLDDENMLTQRAAFDFLITHIPLNSDLLLFSEKALIFEVCLYSLLRKNESIIRRFYTWVLGENKEEAAVLLNENQAQIKVLCCAFGKLIAHAPKDKKMGLAPIFILKMFYDDSNDKLANFILQDKAIEILIYIDKYKDNPLFGIELMKTSTDLFQNEEQMSIIWNAIGAKLMELVTGSDIQKILEIIRIIKFFISTFHAIQEDFADKKKHLAPIFSKVLMSMDSLSSGCKMLENTLPGLQFIQEILEMVSEKLTDPKISEGVNKFTQFYLNLIDGILNKSIDLTQKLENIEIFSRATQVLVKIQVYNDYAKESQEVKMNWLKKLCECSLKSDFENNISQIAIDGIINIWEFSKRGISTYHLLYEFSSKHEKQIISKLWNMVGVSPNDKSVIEQIIRVECVSSSILSNCILAELSDPIIANQLAAINRFSLFWKLSAEYFPIYEPIQSEPCLVQMVDSLSSDHPLIRHSAKSWLSESTRRLDRVLDPILKPLLKPNSNNSEMHNSPENSKSKNFGYIIEGCKRLRMLIIANTTDLLSYMISAKINDELFNLYNKDCAKDIYPLPIETRSYLGLLLFLCLKYISGQIIEMQKNISLSEISAVSACGCELLELILQNMEPDYRFPIYTKPLVRYFLTGLNNTFKQKDTVLQVELLKLVRIIQTKNIRESHAFAENLISLLDVNLFTEILKKGMNSPISYVRSTYIQYVNSSLPIFMTFLGEKFEIILSQLFAILCNALSLCSTVATIKSSDSVGVKNISNQNDIMQIIAGMKSMLHFCFFEVDEEMAKPESMEYQRILGQYKTKKLKTCIEDIRKAILLATGGLILSFEKLWKVHKSRIEKDFNFQVKGMLPLTEEDYANIINSFELHAFSFISLEMKLPIYQKAIISLLQPLIHTCLCIF